MNENELLKQDKITVAVDKCNKILEELDLKVIEVTALNNADKPYSIYKDKLYTNETLEKVTGYSHKKEKALKDLETLIERTKSGIRHSECTDIVKSILLDSTKAEGKNIFNFINQTKASDIDE